MFNHAERSYEDAAEHARVASLREARTKLEAKIDALLERKRELERQVKTATDEMDEIEDAL